MTDSPVEVAWQCSKHGWNTCPLTPSALRYSERPCCAEAVVIATRPARGATGSATGSMAIPPPRTAAAEPAAAAG